MGEAADDIDHEAVGAFLCDWKKLGNELNMALRHLTGGAMVPARIAIGQALVAYRDINLALIRRAIGRRD